MIDATTVWRERSHRIHYLGHNNNYSQHLRVRHNYVSLLLILWLESLPVVLAKVAVVVVVVVVVVTTASKLLWKLLSNHFFTSHNNNLPGRTMPWHTFGAASTPINTSSSLQLQPFMALLVEIIMVLMMIQLPISSHALDLSSLSKTKTTPPNYFASNRSLMMKRRRDLFQDLAFTAASISTLMAPVPVQALTPSEASQAYDQYATTYDALDGGTVSDIFGMEQARSNLLTQAYGSVLEIGCGTGLNLAKYDYSKISSLTLLDVSPGMLQQAKQRVVSMRQHLHQPQSSLLDQDHILSNIRFVQADATSELVQRFGTESFDTVVDTFSFCVMGDQGVRDCLQQMKQVVVKKGRKNDGGHDSSGQLLLLEHTRSSSYPWLGWYQDVTADTAAVWGGKGCVYNQDVSKIIQHVGGIEIVKENVYAAGVFTGYSCHVVLNG
jgi:ubiquinone/menaquinone biosynthesis C-methylase UbiE